MKILLLKKGGIFFWSDINVIFVIEKNVLWRDAT